MPPTRDLESPRRFLAPEVVARTARLDLRAKDVVEGFITGMHKSPFFGHSVEFVQPTTYAPPVSSTTTSGTLVLLQVKVAKVPAT